MNSNSDWKKHFFVCALHIIVVKVRLKVCVFFQVWGSEKGMQILDLEGELKTMHVIFLFHFAQRYNKNKVVFSQNGLMNKRV